MQDLVGKYEGSNYSEYIGVDGRIILKGIFLNRVGGCGLNLFGSVQERVTLCCEHVSTILNKMR
jgi:hypothetical protein